VIGNIDWSDDMNKTYKLNSTTPRDSLAKNYETINDLVITLEIPKTDYKNPHVQNILYWANLPKLFRPKTTSSALLDEQEARSSKSLYRLVLNRNSRIEHDDFYRDLAVTIKTAGDNYRTVLLMKL